MISIPRLERLARGDKNTTPRDAIEGKFADDGSDLQKTYVVRVKEVPHGSESTGEAYLDVVSGDFDEAVKVINDGGVVLFTPDGIPNKWVSASQTSKIPPAGTFIATRMVRFDDSVHQISMYIAMWNKNEPDRIYLRTPFDYYFLPDYSNASNGDSLKIVNGKPAWVAE